MNPLYRLIDPDTGVTSYGAGHDECAQSAPFDYCPITERAPLTWPGGAKVAVYVGLNVEHFVLDEPSTSIWPGTAALRPDALNYGWRDYGARVGIWRTIDSLDRHGIRPSVLLNSAAIDAYPQIVSAGLARG